MNPDGAYIRRRGDKPMNRVLRAEALAVAVLVVVTACREAQPTPAETQFPAVLAGHAILPATTVLSAPPDAPFSSQPVGGHSAARRTPDGSYWVLSDNGTGRKGNAADFMLQLNQYMIDFDSGDFRRVQTLFLSDPQRKAPFPISTNGTAERYLTGSDFDPESLHFTPGAMWIGDEFGPYLLEFDRSGRLLEVFDTMIDGRPARSPDHQDGVESALIQRSRGLEALAGSPDGRMLYPMLEAPLAGESDGQGEAVRILEFDVAERRWTGRYWRYALADPSHAVGDIAMIDARTALVIERDTGYGTADKGCPVAGVEAECFSRPAEFKRIYKFELDDRRTGESVRKIGYVDLMAIADPRRIARVPLTGGALAFPFETIESVDVVDDRHIVVGNDNNFPNSRSREFTRIDDNELVLLEVAELLRAG
jgi:hypothetical protein